MTQIARCWSPLELFSTNVLTGKHWGDRRNTSTRKKEWWKWFRSTEGLGAKINKATGKRQVIVRRAYNSSVKVTKGRSNAMDRMNLCHSVKPLEDALVTLGWLVDDRDEFCDTQVYNVPVKELDEWEKKMVDEKGAVVFVEIWEEGK